MLIPAIVVFALAAVIGLTLAVAHFRGGFPPVGGAVIHGALAATGLGLLFVAVFLRGATGPAQWAFFILLAAGLGGFVLALGFHARKQRLPSALVAGHAMIAVVGFLVLVAGALGLIA